MPLKKSIANLFLKKSNSYRYYKNYYDTHNNKNDLDTLIKEFNKFKKEQAIFKRDTIEHIDSMNFLFNNIYLDYEHTPKKTLQDIKLLCSELLEFVNKVCIKHDITWWMDYGNLLGAVRHGDYVPWDDDIDIGMVRKDYNKFIKVIYDEVKQKKLRDFIDIDYRRKKSRDGKLVKTFMQLWIKKPINDISTILAGVDIFPYDYITAFHYHDINPLYHESRFNFFDNLANKLGYDESLKIMYDELDLELDETDWLIPGVEGPCGPYESYKLMIIDRTKLFPLKPIKFGDKIFPAPNDTHYYLEKIYGNYLAVPKSIRRNHQRVKMFRYLENRSEMFDECLEKMREINEKFE